MNITAVYINTHRYDYESACICVASVRYWHPDIPIYLIKDFGQGFYSTTILEKKWGVGVFDTKKNFFGWGYGKLEPLFLPQKQSFLILDSDTVLTGRVIDEASAIDTDFLVSDEVQPIKMINTIYYNLDRINEIDVNFIYPGYSFNTGQWFGSSNLLRRDDFDKFLDWCEPPRPKHPELLFNGEQGILNFVLQSKEQYHSFNIVRKKIMIWPDGDNANFIDLQKIKLRINDYPFIIHWAGMKYKRLSDYNRSDILIYYQNFFYSELTKFEKFIDKLYVIWLRTEKYLKLKMKL